MSVKFPKSAKYDFNKSLVKRYKLVPHLDKFLSNEVQSLKFEYEPKKDDDGWHPSGMCLPPVTEMYQHAVLATTPGATFKQKEWGAPMLKTFMVGHFWHQLLQHAVVEIGLAPQEAIEVRGMKGWGDSVEPRMQDTGKLVPWKPFHWASGSGDIAPCSIPTHGDYVVDFKTMSSHQFKTNGVPDWAANKYEAQIQIYMDFFGLEKGLIVAINKDSPHDMKEFTYSRNQPLIDAIYDKWEFVSECLDADEAPSALDDEMFTLDGLFQGPISE